MDQRIAFDSSTRARRRKAVFIVMSREERLHENKTLCAYHVRFHSELRTHDNISMHVYLKSSSFI